VIVGPAFFSSPAEVGGDPYYGDTILIMNAQEPDGSSTILDTSPYANSLPGASGMTISGQLVRFDGVDDYRVAAIGSEWDFGTDDFTIEVIADLASLPALWTLLTNRSSSFSMPDTGFILIGNSSGALQAVAWGPPVNFAAVVIVNIVAPASTVTTGLHHVVFQRAGSDWTLGFDGTSVGTATSAAAMGYDPTFGLSVGNDFSAGGRFFHGGMRVRVTRGVARYTFPFTPDFSAWPDPT